MRWPPSRVDSHSRSSVAGSVRRGFTLVELLVVVAICAILFSMLLPAISHTRESAHYMQCCNNLRQIGLATHMYRDLHNGFFPDKVKTGGFAFRMATGMKDPMDPWSRKEIFGLAAVLEKEQLIDPNSGVWICPSAADWMTKYGNTYAFSIATTFSTTKRWEPEKARTTLWVWDNTTLYPGTPGFAGPFSGSSFSIPTKYREYPHRLRAVGRSTPLYNTLFADGHVEYHSP